MAGVDEGDGILAGEGGAADQIEIALGVMHQPTLAVVATHCDVVAANAGG